MSSTDARFDEFHKQMFDLGLETRRSVAGSTYVDTALKNGSSEFGQPMQQFVTEWCWGNVWTRPGLERKQRSLLNLGMLCALNRGPELGVHVRGAINNGLTEVEIREALLQVGIYVGVPAAVEAFKIAEKTINDMIEKGEYTRPSKA